MNEFTKEETIMINNLMAHAGIFYPSIVKDDDFQKLKNKIQSMIENYCEHDLEFIGFTVIGTCKKCKKEIS